MPQQWANISRQRSGIANAVKANASYQAKSCLALAAVGEELLRPPRRRGYERGAHLSPQVPFPHLPFPVTRAWDQGAGQDHETWLSSSQTIGTRPCDVRGADGATSATRSPSVVLHMKPSSCISRCTPAHLPHIQRQPPKCCHCQVKTAHLVSASNTLRPRCCPARTRGSQGH